MMKLSDSDHDSSLSVSPDLNAHAGPSCAAAFEGVIATNGRTNGFGPAKNGNLGAGAVMGNGVQKHGKSVAKVNLPGTTLYDDSFVDRQEFVRLVIQSLRDVGYIESAATLEAESGYAMESPEVSQFRQLILDGLWSKAEAALMRLGVEEDGLWDAKFLISQQKYLELLEAKKPTAALQVLRNELAPSNVDSDQLHTLSSLIMCADPEDLRRQASWDGASGTSRRQLLDALHDYIPSAIMIPQRRFSTLLRQARVYQRQHCLYHNSSLNSTPFSLYSDHRCDKSDFPRITTTILEVHKDEVWNIEWSHDGAYLASASKDKSAIIWRRGSPLGSGSSSPQDWAAHHILRDHQYSVGCLAWSLDDTILLTSAEHFIKLWNAKTGVCIRTLDDHTETVTAISWLPDGSGFISGGLDRKIIIWDTDGKVRDAWGATAIRLTDLALTPDFKHLVAVGMECPPPNTSSGTEVIQSRGLQAGDPPSPPGGNPTPVKMIVFDFATKQTESSTRLEGDLTSVQITQDSQYALINHSPNEIYLWDIHTGRIARKYSGQSQGRHVIRSCFGGIDGNFVVSGSEDGNVYIWHRDTGVLLEVLSGHGEGSVNSVAWNPTNERMFASCSDDHSIRIWEPAPSGMILSQSPMMDHPTPLSFSEKGKGKTRQRLDSNSVGSLSGSDITRL